MAFIAAFFVTCAFAYDYECSIVGKNSVRCEYYLLDNDGESVTGFYRLNADGSWMSKHYVVEKYGRKRVHVLEYPTPRRWACVVDPVSRKMYLPPDSVGPGCEDSGTYFVDMVRSGTKGSIPYFDESLSEEEPRFRMICSDSEGIITNRYNRKTGLPTDRREYRNLLHGTYCEDFVATDGLYWKP